MHVGLQVTSFSYGDAPIDTRLAEIARMAEATGFYSFWVMDHFFQMEGMPEPVDSPMLEAYTTLCYLAAVTERVKLGALVTGVIYRAPALLAKMATTLDVLSAGRSYLGIGAAWYEREAVGLGFPFPPVAQRFEWLEEALQIIQQMWRGDRGPYQGQYFGLAEPISSPQPLSQPHPPIMIGGMGERKTLRMVAQYGDACNLFGYIGPERLRHKLDVLRQHCEDLDRDYDSIEKTVLNDFNLHKQSASEIVDWLGEMAELGFTHAIISLKDVHELTPLEIAGKSIIPAANRL